MSGGVVRRALPGDGGWERLLGRWTEVYGPPGEALAERLVDGRSVVFVQEAGGEVVGFVHFRDRKGALFGGPEGGDETSRLLAESAEFGVYSFEQLYFAGGRWTPEAAAGPLFAAMEEHLGATTVRWALLGQLHTDRRFFSDSEALLAGRGFRRRPGDYVTWELEVGRIPAGEEGSAGGSPLAWRYLRDDPPPPREDLAEAYAEVFPGDPPAGVVAERLATGFYGELSGVGYAAGREGPRPGRGCCSVPTGEPPRPAGVLLVRPLEPGVLWVERLGVSAAHRRGGAVARAFPPFAARCRAAGVERLRFQVRATNEAATALVEAALGARRLKAERFYVKTGWGSLRASDSR